MLKYANPVRTVYILLLNSPKKQLQRTVNSTKRIPFLET